MKMEPRISKICMSLEELETIVQIKNPVDNDNVESVGRYRRRPNNTNVNTHFHCPVTGCVYDAVSERYFTRLKYLKQHFIKVHASKSFICEKCRRGFAKLSNLTAHRPNCGIPFKCTCGVVYTTREALLTHAKRKQHVLPNGPKVIIREKTKKINTENATIVGKSCNTKSVVQPTTLIVYLNKQAATTENVSCVKKPCFILPKPAPIHDLPLPTVAAMALSELADSEFVKQKVAVGVQTEDYGKCKEKRVSCGCKHNEIRKEANGHHSKSVRRINKRSMETQTSRSTVVKKRTRWALSDQGTQTDLITSRLQNLTSSTIATQTIPQVTNNDVEQPLDPPVMPNLYGTSNAPYLLDGSRDWYLADSVMSPLPFSTEHLAANSKICQTIKELDVDVNFNLSALVSSSTQTSPRTSVFSRGLNCPSPGHLLDGSLPGYLDMDTLPILQDYSMLSCSNNSYLPQDSESGVLKHCNLGNVEHLSSETQTDCNFSSLLLTDGGSCDSGEDDVGILSSNIQTQTSEDLESIPYDQLWSHTETQTSDPFLFSDLGGLCDIQTQTGYESCNPSVVDTHTQTCIQQTEGLTSQQINMETQTLLSLLEGHVSPFTDSHTQTSSIMGILEYCCAASELDTD